MKKIKYYTIDKDLLRQAKVYAQKKQISLSSLFEDYFRTLAHMPPERQNILDIVDKLQPEPKVVRKSKNKTSIYESQKKKYGF